jgi:hypothetical protein
MPAQTGRHFLKVSEERFEGVARARLGGFHLRGRQSPRCCRGGGTLIFTGASGCCAARPILRRSPPPRLRRARSRRVWREFGPQGIHVGHIVIDGGIEGDRLLSLRPELKDARGPDGLLNIAAIADAYWVLHHQHRSAWTLELDLRPWAESF